MTVYQIVQGQHYIRGQFVSPDPLSTKYFDSKNPATGEILGSFPEATVPDVESAYQIGEMLLKGGDHSVELKGQSIF